MVRFLTVLFVVVLSLPGPGRAGELDGIRSPHEGSPSCTSCHTEVPTSEDAGAGRYSLRAGSIDETCCICHVTKCKPLDGGKNHPSNINRWNRAELKVPATLPLYDGYITCLTCHYRNRPEGADYKRVRLVKIMGDRVDWSGLCRDCHSDH